jgi:hypothetical protein
LADELGAGPVRASDARVGHLLGGEDRRDQVVERYDEQAVSPFPRPQVLDRRRLEGRGEVVGRVGG